MRKRVGLATSAALPDLFEDDRLLLPAAREAGWTAVPAVWTDRSIDWSGFDAVVLRSTWDYHRRFPEFMEWIGRCASTTHLFNDLDTVRWNGHKSYLLDLARRGVPTVPTEMSRAGEDLEEVARRQDWSDVVVKPAISANAEGARLVERDEIARFEPEYRSAAARGEWLVQPFLPSVADRGERSLVFFDGQLSHAFRKGPALPTDRRKAEGTRPAEASPAEIAVARWAVAAVSPVPLYARVDLVADLEGDPVVMELELIEPLLVLATDPEAPGRFVRALAARFGNV